MCYVKELPTIHHGEPATLTFLPFFRKMLFFFKDYFSFLLLLIFCCCCSAGSSLLCSGFLLLQRMRGLVFIAVHRLLIAWLLLLWNTGSQHTGVSTYVDSVVAAHGLGCSMACEIFLDQGLNPCALPWQAYSYPLYHQGSPVFSFQLEHSSCTMLLVSGAHLIHSGESVIHISILFQTVFLHRLLQNIEYSSLCYTVGPCWLSILYTVVCVCSSQSPNLSLPPPFPH